MGNEVSPALIPLSGVEPRLGSSEEYQPYGGESWPWVVSKPNDERKPSFVFKMDPTKSVAQITSIRLGKDSNVKYVTVIITYKRGDTTPIYNVGVTPDGLVAFSEPVVFEDVKEVEIVFEEPNDDSGVYQVSPNVQGCFGDAKSTVATTPLSTTTSVGTTTSQAIVTTTTTPQGTVTTFCPLTSEMPAQAPQYGDNQFTVIRGDGVPSDVQPNKDGWKPSVTEERPVMRIELPPTKTGDEPRIQSITIVDYLPITVTIIIYSRDQPDPVYNEKVDMPDSGSVTVYPSPRGESVPASSITVELGEPKYPDVPNYDTKITLVGCFEPIAEIGRAHV